MLKDVRIVNFRSCEDAELNLTGPLTALVGRNGAGKTNILLALQWLARTAVSPVVPDPPPRFPSPKPIGITATLELEGQLYRYQVEYARPRMPGQGSTTLCESLVLVTANGDQLLLSRKNEEVRLRGRSELIRIGGSAPSIFALLSLLSDREEVNTHLKLVFRFFAALGYYSLEEPSDATNNLVFERDYQKWRQKYVAEGTLTNSVALRLLYMHFEDKPLLKEFASLVGPRGLDLVTFSGFHTFKPEQGKEENNPDKESNSIHFFHFSPLRGMGGSGRPCGFHDLSAGTQRVIRMLVSLLFDRRSVMLVEQPEDSVHPGLLRKLIDLFRSYAPRTQVVFTTHSAEVLNMLDPSEIRLVEAKDGKTRMRALTPEQIQQAQQFLKDTGPLSEFVEVLDGEAFEDEDASPEPDDGSSGEISCEGEASGEEES